LTRTASDSAAAAVIAALLGLSCQAARPVPLPSVPPGDELLLVSTSAYGAHGEVLTGVDPAVPFALGGDTRLAAYRYPARALAAHALEPGPVEPTGTALLPPAIAAYVATDSGGTLSWQPSGDTVPEFNVPTGTLAAPGCVQPRVTTVLLPWDQTDNTITVALPIPSKAPSALVVANGARLIRVAQSGEATTLPPLSVSITAGFAARSGEHYYQSQWWGMFRLAFEEPDVPTSTRTRTATVFQSGPLDPYPYFLDGDDSSGALELFGAGPDGTAYRWAAPAPGWTQVGRAFEEAVEPQLMGMTDIFFRRMTWIAPDDTLESDFGGTLRRFAHGRSSTVAVRIDPPPIEYLLAMRLDADRAVLAVRSDSEAQFLLWSPSGAIESSYLLSASTQQNFSDYRTPFAMARYKDGFVYAGEQGTFGYYRPAIGVCAPPNLSDANYRFAIVFEQADTILLVGEQNPGGLGARRPAVAWVEFGG
jgi:hypothetical protein